jgi:hypothetical protein
MTPKAIIELYGARWNIETTFQELRSQLGLETTRGWSRMTVLRMAPCLIELYTLVFLLYDQINATTWKHRIGRRSRYDEGSGRHSLWLTVGGSVGHSGRYKLDINEGRNSALTGRD